MESNFNENFAEKSTRGFHKQCALYNGGYYFEVYNTVVSKYSMHVCLP